MLPGNAIGSYHASPRRTKRSASSQRPEALRSGFGHPLLMAPAACELLTSTVDD